MQSNLTKIIHSSVTQYSLVILLCIVMLQVILILRLIRFQIRSVCFAQGQLVSTQVGLGQVQNTGHRSLLYQ